MSVMAGITMNVEKWWRKMVMKRWLNPHVFSIFLSQRKSKAKEREARRGSRKANSLLTSRSYTSAFFQATMNVDLKNKRNRYTLPIYIVFTVGGLLTVLVNVMHHFYNYKRNYRRYGDSSCAV